MIEIYDKCQVLEISPEQIGYYLAETINLSEKVYPSQIPNYQYKKEGKLKNLKSKLIIKKIYYIT